MRTKGFEVRTKAVILASHSETASRKTGTGSEPQKQFGIGRGLDAAGACPRFATANPLVRWKGGQAPRSNAFPRELMA